MVLSIAIWILGAEQEANDSCSLLERVLRSINIGEGAVDALAIDSTIPASIAHLKDRRVVNKVLEIGLFDLAPMDHWRDMRINAFTCLMKPIGDEMRSDERYNVLLLVLDCIVSPSIDDIGELVDIDLEVFIGLVIAQCDVGEDVFDRVVHKLVRLNIEGLFVVDNLLPDRILIGLVDELVRNIVVGISELVHIFSRLGAHVVE